MPDYPYRIRLYSVKCSAMVSYGWLWQKVVAFLFWERNMVGKMIVTELSVVLKSFGLLWKWHYYMVTLAVVWCTVESHQLGFGLIFTNGIYEAETSKCTYGSNVVKYEPETTTFRYIEATFIRTFCYTPVCMYVWVYRDHCSSWT